MEKVLDPSNVHERTIIEKERRWAALATRRMAYHTAMVRKYQRAARYPWLPVEPDRRSRIGEVVAEQGRGGLIQARGWV